MEPLQTLSISTYSPVKMRRNAKKNKQTNVQNVQRDSKAEKKSQKLSLSSVNSFRFIHNRRTIFRGIFFLLLPILSHELFPIKLPCVFLHEMR